MRTQTKTKTEAITTTKLLIATLVTLAAGGAAFAMLPFNKTSKPITPVNQISTTKKPIQTITTNATRLAVGCYFVVDQMWYLLHLNEMQDSCQDIYLANEFGRASVTQKKDLYKLIKVVDPNLGDTLMMGDVVNAVETRVVLIGRDNNDNETQNIFSPTRNQFHSPVCETINYFGIPLNCFNAIDNNNNKRENNLKYIIPYFTVLRITSNSTQHNPLLERDVTALGLIKEIGTQFYDATIVTLVPEEMRDRATECFNDESNSAIHKTLGVNRSRSAVVICPKMLNQRRLEEAKIHSTAILYHEVNHFFDNLSHNNTIGWKGERYNADCPNLINRYQTNCDINKPLGHIYCMEDQMADGTYRKGDVDWATVYGAHITYLFKMSNNNSLSDEDRCTAYKRAEAELNDKLCHSPHTPTHNHPRPTGCN